VVVPGQVDAEQPHADVRVPGKIDQPDLRIDACIPRTGPPVIAVPTAPCSPTVASVETLVTSESCAPSMRLVAETPRLSARLLRWGCRSTASDGMIATVTGTC